MTILTWVQVLWALLAVAVVALAWRWIRRNRTMNAEGPPPPGRLLAERYVRGEIDSDEFSEHRGHIRVRYLDRRAAERLLNVRYARGEIDTSVYRERRHHLHGGL